MSDAERAPDGPRGGRGVAKAVLAAALVAGLVGSSGYFLYGRSARSATEHRTIQPSRATIRRTIVANGTILPRKEVAVKPQISGVVDKILVERGDRVRAGDLLAVIRPLPNPDAVNAAEAELRSARIALAHAQREFERIEALVKRDLVARIEHDKLSTDLRLAEERVTAAQRRLEIVQTGASAALGRNASEARATIDGTILERPIELGGFVIETNTFNEGTTIVSIADMSDLVFRGKVDQPDAGRLRVGMPVSVVVGALPGERFPGQLDFIAPKSTDKDGVTTFEIRASLVVTPGRFVRAGYSATADLVVAQREAVLALPERHVRFQDGRPYVMRESAPGVFERRPVTLGLSDGITTEVVSGLRADDRVLAE